jgi:AmmeMemoRadiSam system protein B
MIVPHAGHAYSGPVAASGYRRLRPARTTIRRVVLVGPAHRHPFRGVATHTADCFETPLGRVPVDPAVRDLPEVRALDTAHDGEHSLEVHLPFLQVALDTFRILPLLVGQAPHEQVVRVLDAAWGGPETLVVVSSDLSHFHAAETARGIDRATADAILAGRGRDLCSERACGWRGVAALLDVAGRRGLHPELLDLRNSGDTGGDAACVVGYGTFVFS